MDKDITNIIFYGVGGQGVLKASEVCAWAAMKEGFSVKKTEVHGMSQRGGSVDSQLRFGKDIFSPVIPFGKTDILVCLYASEYHIFKDALKKEGIDLLPYLKKAEEYTKDNKKFMNTFMLGVLSHYLPIKEKNWIQAIKLIFPEKTFGKNNEVFNAGRKIGGNL